MHHFPRSQRERDSGFKHLQLLAGAPVTAFWAANYAADLAAFSIPAAGIVALAAASGRRLPSLQGPRLAAFGALLWAFGGAGLSLTYVLHPLFAVRGRLGGRAGGQAGGRAGGRVGLH
jgi:hypothetical protein